jgi:hypothetical protein
LNSGISVFENSIISVLSEDHLQLEAARIVTGLPIFASSILTYKELGWESLAERRKRRKLQIFYNIQNNNAPMYLCDLIPPSI